MVDIHAHILPGVDDGAKDIKDSLAIARKLIEKGITHVVATPHYMEDLCQLTPEETEKRVEQLQSVFSDEGLNIKVLPGAEAYITADLGKKVKSGQIATLNNSRYILVELPMNSIPGYVHHVFYDLLVLGYTPIIAHPERNSLLFKRQDYLKAWLEEGVLLQLNAGSLLGIHGPSVKSVAKKLLINRKFHFIASDIHTGKEKNRSIFNGFEKIKKLTGFNNGLFCYNARRVIDNLAIDHQEQILQSN